MRFFLFFFLLDLHSTIVNATSTPNFISDALYHPEFAPDEPEVLNHEIDHVDCDVEHNHSDESEAEVAGGFRGERKVGIAH